MRNRKLIIYLFSLLLLVKSVSGQEKEIEIAKNTLGFSAFTVLFRGGGSFNYERFLFRDGKTNIYLNTGFGAVYFLKNVHSTKDDSHHTYFVSAEAIPVSFHLIAGESNHCLEVNIGLYVLINESAQVVFDDYSSIYTDEYKKSMFSQFLIWDTAFKNHKEELYFERMLVYSGLELV